MNIQIITIFPEIFDGFLRASLVGKALEHKLLNVRLIDIRNFAELPHKKVDDTPYGGGAGMLMKPEPLALAIEDAKSRAPNAQVILLTPAGKQFTQSIAHDLSKESELILICGRYEGVDQRVIDLFVDTEISIGDYVLMGGEVPAMVLIESCIRLREQVIGNSDSLSCESFSSPSQETLLEAPHYTRPAEFRGLKVPEVLLSGNHEKIKLWREAQSKALTQSRRPGKSS